MSKVENANNINSPSNASDALWEQERVARISNNLDELYAIQLAIVQSSSSDDELISLLKILQHKRKQSHETFKRIIEYVVSMNNNIPFLTRLQSDIVGGKLYLEKERVQIAEILMGLHGDSSGSKIHNTNTLERSYAVISNVPVETFTSIDERKKNSILFETFRLGFLLKRHTECELTLRKIRQTDLTTEERVVYENYRILLLKEREAYLEASEHYEILMKIEPSAKNVTLGSYYAIISNSLSEGLSSNSNTNINSTTNSTNTNTNSVNSTSDSTSSNSTNLVEKRINLLSMYYAAGDNNELMRMIVNKFLSTHIIHFSVIADITSILTQYATAEVVDPRTLRQTILEHNLRVIRRYFSKCRMSEIAYLMQITEEEAVEFITRMVNNKHMSIKINQETSMVDMGEKKWNREIEGVLDRIIEANHLIAMEEI